MKKYILTVLECGHFGIQLSSIVMSLFLTICIFGSFISMSAKEAEVNQIVQTIFTLIFIITTILSYTFFVNLFSGFEISGYKYKLAHNMLKSKDFLNYLNAKNDESLKEIVDLGYINNRIFYHLNYMKDNQRFDRHTEECDKEKSEAIHFVKHLSVNQEEKRKEIEEMMASKYEDKNQ